MTNVSEFERNKPRETYREIENLIMELEALLDHGKTSIDIQYVLNKAEKIKKVFVSGR
tara:strand:+ start:3216 stop:3389 length:174 start_codon:yes stop_codon:yes gene_type:complete